MKNTNKICALFFILISISATGFTQEVDTLNLPGANLNLYGVLYLFKESNSLAEFEKKLNTPENKVNNLDLDNDGLIDYIRVRDYAENGVHSIVLQDPISETEAQDLAVIEIEQRGNDVAHIQIVGNEDLYGKNYIIEPRDEQETEQYAGNGEQTPMYNEVFTPVTINVWFWPSIQYIYAPTYVCYNSPCYYNSYPIWWTAWQPVVYVNYWSSMVVYQMPYHLVHKNRLIVALNMYHVHKKESMLVHNNISNNVYNGPRTGGGKTTLHTALGLNNPIKGFNGPKTETGGGKTPEPKQLVAHNTVKHFNSEPKTTGTYNTISSNSYTEPKHQTSYNVSSTNSEPKHQSVSYSSNSNSYSEPKHQTEYHNTNNSYNEPKHIEVHNSSSFSKPKQQVEFHNSSNSNSHVEAKPQNEFHGGGGKRR